MKEACEGAYGEKAWKCALEMVIHLFLSLVSLHVPQYILGSYSWYLSIFCHLLCHIPLPSHFLSVSLSHFLCHFATTANILLAQTAGCRLLVLVYLALGSIRLQAEASHSSQSHKMWLVLTTALQGDGLIGLIASDRLGWTLYRKTRATACCGFILTVFCSFFPFLFSLSLSVYLFLTLIFVDFFLPLSLSLSSSLSLYVAVFRLSLFISHFLFVSYLSLTSLYAHKLHSSSQT